MVDALQAVGYRNNIDEFGQTPDSSSPFRDTVTSVFRGIGNVSRALGDSFLEAGASVSALSGQSMYANSLRMMYNGGWGWGWGPGVAIWGYPMYFGPLDALFVGGTGASYGCGCQCGSSFGGSNLVGVNNFSQSPSAMAAQAMDVSGLGLSDGSASQQSLFIPINNPSSVAEAFTLIDKVNHPNNYNSDGTSKSATLTTDPKNKPMELVDSQTGKRRTPVWYRQIANKVEQNKSINETEKEIYQRYNKLFRTYSPYELDENLDSKLDSNGQPIESSLNAELLQLQHWIEGKCREDIEAYVNSCEPEKLAALELHYPMLEFSNGKSLRDAIKDACIVQWLEWSSWNSDRCQRIFDKMDEAAMMSPTNMKNALQQALENHRMFGFGYDEQRVIKLLKQMEGNKVFRDYVKMEYPGLINDVRKKWFKCEEVEDLLRKIFS